MSTTAPLYVLLEGGICLLKEVETEKPHPSS